MRVPATVFGILLLAPVAAHAQSEYAACLNAQLSGMGSERIRVAKPFGLVPTSTSAYAQYSTTYIYSSYYGVTSILDSSSASRAADRLSAMARSCRQYRDTTPPNYRVVTIKSPSLSPAANGPR